MKKIITITASVLTLTGCQDTAQQNLELIAKPAKPAQNDEQTANTADNPHDLAALAKQLDDGSVPDEVIAKPIITADGKTQINWQLVDTKTTKVSPEAFNYPFATDSQPVLNYAKNFNITPTQAQHAMMLSMASPEALGKIVDQLGGKYLSHSFRDGDNPALVIQTTPDVVAQTHDYVIADTFAKGLVLPIEIVNKTKP